MHVSIGATPYQPSRSCGFRYNDAMITIRRVPSVDHNFQLVVTRVYEDGDQELLEDEEESTSTFQVFSSLATHQSRS